MKKKTTLVLMLLTSFALGFALNAMITKSENKPSEHGRVTGIGGIFFKSKDPKKLREWYSRHLGIITNRYGGVFEWRQGADSSKKGFTQWSPFGENTKYFEPSTKEFMINYRVNNLEALLTQLKNDGVTIADTMQVASYGKFIHIMDLEGNKLELWEPNDVEYDKLGKAMGAKTNM
jgi:predicted enzyme related to lactoylglutathione lyase